MRHRRLELPCVVFPAVAEGATVGRGGGDVVPGRSHAQRREEQLLDEILVGLSGHVGDDAAEQRVAEIRVLHRHRRRPREWHAVAQQTREVVFGQRRLPIAPGIVGDEPRGVRQQFAHANLRRVFRRILPPAQLRHVGFDRRVERELALVSELQDRQRRERLRHRRDAEQRVSGDGTLRVDVLHARALHVHQPAVLHDAPHHAGDVRVEAVVLHRAIDLGEHRRVLGEHGLSEDALTIITAIATAGMRARLGRRPAMYDMNTPGMLRPAGATLVGSRTSWGTRFLGPARLVLPHPEQIVEKREVAQHDLLARADLDPGARVRAVAAVRGRAQIRDVSADVPPALNVYP